MVVVVVKARGIWSRRSGVERRAAESGGKQSIFERQMSADLKYRATQI